ncbi:MAG: NAD(P)H-hydrate epimerase [Candidatus Brocadiia bacterium]
MRYLSRAQMRKSDRIAIERYGIPALVLMENAGRIVAEQSAQLLSKSSPRRVLVICGKGNNGGDGLVAARYLAEWGVKTYILLLDKLINPDRSAETAVNLRICHRLKIPISTDYHRLLRHGFKSYGLVIDAIFGVGLERAVLPPYSDIIRAINDSGRPVIAVDIPSGLDADTGKPLGIAVQTEITVTMAAPKKGFRTPGARAYIGRVIVADIGIPPQILTSLT